jgi:hypothetical protein
MTEVEGGDTSRRRLLRHGIGTALALVGGAALLEACEVPGTSSGLQIKVNGRQHAVHAAPDTPLL